MRNLFENSLSRILFLGITAIYCTIALWAASGTYTTNFWIIFACTLIAPVIALVSTFSKDVRNTKVAFLTLMYRAVVIHFVGQLLMHLLLLAPEFPSVILALIEAVFALILIVYVSYFGVGTREVSKRIQEQQKELRYLANLQVTLQFAYDSAANNDVKNALNKLLETVQYSPFESIPETEKSEKELLVMANELDSLTPEEQLVAISRMQVILNKRNNLVSMLG